ncbi:MAG: phosphoglucosamine mutase [Flavobacteriales bacterium TMED123]|nr:MAG: phosphoglucosamine mutase [Flavobacteriales bacterium TMED123]|tara:strand:- start:2080 stop:3459 length:1380 start_codon:yes stop_codon:yes gene_type:complete
MTLIKSISGIRGTIGGQVGNALTPLDIVKFTAAYADFIKNQKKNSNTIIIGRDARISGEMVSNIVSGTLIGCGFDVLDIGLSSTPTVEVVVQLHNSAGGIILTASHNPKEWNALKLLNDKGEFLSARDGEQILQLAESEDFCFSNVDEIGKYTFDSSYNDKHIDEVLNLNLVDVDLVKSAGFKVVVDAVNSTGGFMVPQLLKKMGVECVRLYCEPNGYFPHNPEPIPENLTDISELVVKEKADFGIVVDPDVDRLAMVCEDGSMFGEEYTLVTIADFVLSKTPGNTVSNLSSTRALKEVTQKHNGNYQASAVGEVNVVEKMKSTNAIIGGEGNGGVIYPALHYGRDALVGIALFLTQLAERKISAKTLRASYPNYFISKNKIELTDQINVDALLLAMQEKYKDEQITTIDGLKIDFKEGWVHLRKSNTEPIIRIYAESEGKERANAFAQKMINEIKELI